MDKQLTAIIADDEPLLRRQLDNMLSELWPQLEVVARAVDGEQVLAAVERYQPDIVFLDINMPVLDGMTTAVTLNQQLKPPLIVFITAYDQYAVQAFENNAVDYLLKPISESRLNATKDKLITRCQQPQSIPDTQQLARLISQMQQATTLTPKTYLQWIKASAGEDIHLIAITDVLFFKAEEKYVSVYVGKNGGLVREFLIRMSLKEILSQLNHNEFWQIHRSTVVNVSKIDKVNKTFTGQMYVYIGNEKLPVSRALKSLFKGM
ncbi:LytR/AlgR family response regulator transcription factor [Photobacterium kishitanii]|uniref:LytR/AlgR family response regulator transcription factor n=1 Tax=Photobacterium kishitanii TaxID=318456 RepID=UPI000D1682A1|nr:LytTR family DNA-binding domain-containing protein [Photobacterium kishitanii]PSV19151.1 DNA-binding response regulator [Photobacterium kishitanii]